MCSNKFEWFLFIEKIQKWENWLYTIQFQSILFLNPVFLSIHLFIMNNDVLKYSQIAIQILTPSLLDVPWRVWENINYSKSEMHVFVGSRSPGSHQQFSVFPSRSILILPSPHLWRGPFGTFSSHEELSFTDIVKLSLSRFRVPCVPSNNSSFHFKLCPQQIRRRLKAEHRNIF